MSNTGPDGTFACLNETIARLDARRVEMERLDVTIRGAALCNELIDELRAAAEAQANKLYTLGQAAVLCNLSRDHIGRLVSQGKIPNAGRKGAPRIRGADLPNPKLRRSIATSTGSLYDPVADARKLGSRQKGGP